MVNELRTLLLNERATPAADFEELIDPGFRPRPLPPAASVVRAEALRGSGSSRSFRNAIATLLARLAYAGQTGEAFGDLLDRRTFLEDRPLVAPALSTSGGGAGFTCGGTFAPSDPAIGVLNWQLRAVPVAAPEILAAQLFATNAAGTGEQSLTITVQPAGPSWVQIFSSLPGAPAMTLPVAFTADSSLPIPLSGGGGVFVQFVGVPAVPAGFNAVVTARRPFAYDVLDLLERLRARPETSTLFSLSAPGAALAAIYGQPGYPHEALAAVLFAYAFAVREPQP